MSISWIAEKMPCGCGIRKFAPEETYDIEYCPKHKAAQEMYEALKSIRDYMVQYREAVNDNSHWPILEKMNQAVAKAEDIKEDKP